MGKTYTRPKAVTSKSSGIKPYLEKASTSFPNMMRRVTQAAADWRQKKKHSELMKPYLVSPDIPWPDLDMIYPPPFNIEFPPIGEDWTNIESFGEEAWKFKCIISCQAKLQSTTKNCEEPIKCFMSAWTYVTDPCTRFRVYLDFPGTPSYPMWYNITDMLECKFFNSNIAKGSEYPHNSLEQPRLQTESVAFTHVKIRPNANFGHSWAGVFSYLGVEEGDWLSLRIIYFDKGQSTGRYFNPKMKKWITILAGASQCEDRVSQGCSQCPPEVAVDFDEDSTPDVIAPGAAGEITLYLTEGAGVGPFTWTISAGEGYTLGAETTSGYTNTLVSAAGVCGTDYSATVTIQVEDSCGGTDTILIRNTGGQAVFTQNMCYDAPCDSFSTHCAGSYVGNLVYHTDIIKPFIGDVACDGCCCDEVLANLDSWGLAPGGGGDAAFKCWTPTNACRWSCADGDVWDRGSPYNVDEFEWTC